MISRPVSTAASTSPVSHVILCVDDEPAGLRARTMVLESAGYKVIPTTSAAEALEIFTTQHIDLVLTDHLLQGTTGVEVAKQMKALHPDVPIVIFSGAVDVALAIDKLTGSHTADMFLSKSVGPSEMLVRLAQLLKL